MNCDFLEIAPKRCESVGQGTRPMTMAALNGSSKRISGPVMMMMTFITQGGEPV